MFQMIFDELTKAQQKLKENDNNKTKLGKMCDVEVYMTPNQKNDYIRTLIETEYVSKDKIRDKIKELEENIEESKRMIKNATEEDEKIWWQEELRKCVTGKVYLKELLGE